MSAGIDIGTNFAGGCAVEVGKVVKRQARYCYEFNKLVKDLDDGHEKLKTTRDGMQLQFEKDKANTKAPSRDLQLQLTAANELIEKVEELKGKAEAKKSCCNGACPNWICRYFVGKKAEKKTEAMKELNEQLGHKLSPAHRLSLRCVRSSSEDFILFKCTEEARHEILKALGDDKKIRIGLCGMGGCGKTSLLRNVHKEMEDSTVYKTAFVVVSNPPNYHSIQGSIASWIGLEFKTEENVEDRAARLSMAFQRDKKYLIILDNVWQKLDFGAIGIPVGNNCKVLISSRKRHILEWMQCEPNIIYLSLLTNEEAWELFQNLTGEIEDPFQKEVARKIADECYRLPVAIKAMASTLKGEANHVWEEAMETLKDRKEPLNIDRDGLEDPYRCLKYSFDELKKDSQELSLYLLCALFPNDSEIAIEVLIRFSFGLGIFEDINSYRRVRSKVRTTIDTFKKNCLLLPEGKHVKLHDMFHALALWEAKKKTQVIMGPEQIVDLTKKDYMKDTNRLYCHGIEKFPNQLNCPELEILIVTNNGRCSSKFPDMFFKEMMKLKVLTIENTSTGTKPDLLLPQSMKGLKKLRALCLRGWTLINVSMFEKLEMLDTVELFHCVMEELPKELANMKALKLLEVSNCELGGDPYKVLATCSHLEELYFVCNNFPEMVQLIGQKVAEFFCQICSFKFLQRYHLGLGGSIYTSKDHSSSKLISINNFDASSIRNEAFQALSQTLEVLFFEKIQGDCTNIIPDMFPIQGKCLSELQEFVIRDSDGIKCLIDTPNDQLHQGRILFTKLQKLKVEAMKCLKALCHSPPHSGLFINLKELFITNCIQLESLFTTTIAQMMGMLEVLEVIDCDNLRDMIKVGNDEDEYISEGSVLTRLKQIRVKGCKNLKFLLPISFASGLLQLKTLEIEDAAELQHVFGFDNNENDQNEKQIDLSDVKLKLINLPIISSICPQNYDVKWPLDKPVVTGCPQLSGIFDLDSEVRQQDGDDAKEQAELLSVTSGEERRSNTIVRTAKDLVQATARQARYLYRFNIFVDELKKEKDLLVSKGIPWSQLMSEYEVQERNLIEEVEMLEREAEGRKSCCNGVFPNWLGRYVVGKRIGRLIETVKELNERITRSNYVKMFESRKGPYDEILVALKDDEIYMIGLCGMGGCGKTTLIKQVIEEVKSLKLFNTVAFVEVSYDPNTRRLQDQIADLIGLSLEEEQSEMDRAARLSMRLNNGDKILIILDDIQQVLKLVDVGIPLHKNCKVVLTTRHQHLCTMMDCQEMVYLSILTEQEAWNLFQEHAGVIQGTSENLAQQIVRECKGLPLAIVTVAKHLKNKPEATWKDSIKRLAINDDIENISEMLKGSIDNLGDESRSLFFLCAIFPESSTISLEILIRFATGLRIFKDVHSYERVRIKVGTTMDELIDSHLLIQLGNKKKQHFRMPDLMRDVALNLEKKFIVIMGHKVNLRILTDRGYMKDTTRLYCHNLDKYPDQLNSSKLEFLFLSSDGGFLEDFSDTFFIEVIELKVLTITDASIWKTPNLPLPQSMEGLKKLRTVCLRGWTLNNISILGKLEMLDTVELLFCVIKELPEEFAELRRLRLLEASGCKIQNSPFDVLTRCSQLEELYFVENILPELEPSDHNVVKLLHQIGSSKALRRYHLEIGSSIDTLENDLITKFISINGFNIHTSNEEMKNMAQKLEVLFLENVQGDCKSIFPDLIPIDEECMNELTELLLQDSDNMECLIDTTNHPLHLATTVFSKLLKLKIRTMRCLKALCCGQSPFNLFEALEELFIVECSQLQCIVSMGKLNFCNLKHLQLEDCPKLTSVFTYSTAQSMVLLEILKVQDCISLRQIIKDEEEDEITPVGPIFPNLNKVYVRGCPHFEFSVPASFLGGLPQLSIISDLDSKVEIQRGGGKSKEQESELPEIQSSDMVGQSVEDNLVEECQMEGIFELTESTIIGSNSVQLSCLQRLVLENLPDLRYIHEDQEQLLKLRRMKIYKCGGLKCIFSLRLMTYLSALQELIIEDCPILEQIIEHDYHNGRCTDTGPFSDNSNLQKITVKSCPILGSLFTVSTAKTLRFMRTLKIEECPQMKFLLIGESAETYKRKNPGEEDDRQAIFPNLSFLSLKNLPEFIHVCEGENLKAVKGVMFPESFSLYNLQSLIVKSCPMLTSLFTVSTAKTLMWLTSLVIIDSSALEYLIEGKSKEIAVSEAKEILSRLKILHLVKLPRLIIIHRGIKLQCELCHIHDCPMLEQTFADVVKPDDLLQERKAVDKAIVGNTYVDSLSPTMASCSSEVVALPSGSNTTEAAEAHPHAQEFEIVDALEGLQGQNFHLVGSMNSRESNMEIAKVNCHEESAVETSSEVLIDKQPQSVTDPEQALQEDKVSLPLPGQSALLSPSRTSIATTSPTLEAPVSSSKQQHQMVEQLAYFQGQSSCSHLPDEASVKATSSNSHLTKQDATSAPHQEMLPEDIHSKVRGASEFQPHSENFDAVVDVQSSLHEQYNSRESSLEIVKGNLHEDPGPKESTVGSSSQIEVELSQVVVDSQKVHEEYEGSHPLPVHPTVLSSSTSITTTPLTAEVLTSSSSNQHLAEESVDFHGLFKIKERQASILEEAFVKYQHLWEWKLSQRTLRICKVGYKSLVDMLAFLKSETPKTMDDSKMEKFEDLCYELEYFGFDKMWLASIRQRVMDMQADHNNKLKQADQLESQIGTLEEQLSDARASLASVKDDISKPGHVFGF